MLKVVFVEIIWIAWFTLDEDLSGQIYQGKHELALRAVGQSKVPAEAKLDSNAVMTIQVGCEHGKFEPLPGMLDTSAGINVMSVSA